jgi:hypothetical protein
MIKTLGEIICVAKRELGRIGRFNLPIHMSPTGTSAIAYKEPPDEPELAASNYFTITGCRGKQFFSKIYSIQIQKVACYLYSHATDYK